MFKVNDYIIYGGSGVCKILNVGPSPLKSVDQKRQYYKLQQIYEGKSVIYTPVDNDKVTMRAIASAEQAIELINEINEIEATPFEDDKREAECKAIINTYDCRELIKICKGLHLVKERRLAEGKNFSSTDNKYLKIAKDFLLGEFSISLDKSREDVGQLIMDKAKWSNA